MNPDHWYGKPYYSLDAYCKNTFHHKCYKIALNAHMSCPNRDGTLDTRGCIFCSAGGSGDFAVPTAGKSIRRQLEQGLSLFHDKKVGQDFIAYFQAYTNTYAPLERLRALFEEAVTLPDAVGLNVATRADCLPDEVIAYLAELSVRTVVTVELGLQTAHDETARLINRGHDLACFEETFFRIRRMAPRVRIGIHLILGLIGENDEMMVQTVQKVAELRPDEVKLHCLYVQEGTKIAEIYRNGGYFPLEREHYVSLVVQALELLPPEVVVGRLTGDGDRNCLLAPLWTKNKRAILNEIDKKFYVNNSFQGKRFLNSAYIKP